MIAKLKTIENAQYYIVGYKGNFIANVTVPEVINDKTIEFIDGQAFMGCRRLKKIDLPGSLTLIEAGAFGMCHALKKVVFRGTTEEWKRIAYDGIFKDASAAVTVLCNDGDVAYKKYKT